MEEAIILIFRDEELKITKVKENIQSHKVMFQQMEEPGLSQMCLPSKSKLYHILLFFPEGREQISSMVSFASWIVYFCPSAKACHLAEKSPPSELWEFSLPDPLVEADD